MQIADRVAAMVGIFLNFVPQLVGALVVLIIGVIVAKIAELVVRRGLGLARLDQRVEMSDIGQSVQQVASSPAHFLGRVVYWLIFASSLALALSVLQVPALNAFVSTVFAYVPSIIAALLILLVAGGFSALFSGAIRRTMGETTTGKIAATAIPAVIMTIATFMALNQLGIARDIVNITFTALIGALALGMALAFGLGGREVAAKMLEEAYAKGREGLQQARSDVAMAREQVSSVATAPAEAAESEEASEPDAVEQPEWAEPRGTWNVRQPAFGETLNPTNPKDKKDPIAEENTIQPPRDDSEA